MNLLNSVTGYFRGVFAEGRKVTWPSWQTLVRYLVSVILGIALATVFIGAVDYVFYHALSFFISK